MTDYSQSPEREVRSSPGGPEAEPASANAVGLSAAVSRQELKESQCACSKGQPREVDRQRPGRGHLGSQEKEFGFLLHATRGQPLKDFKHNSNKI